MQRKAREFEEQNKAKAQYKQKLPEKYLSNGLIERTFNKNVKGHQLNAIDIQESNDGKVMLMDESNVSKIMTVLRGTNTAISQLTLQQRESEKMHKRKLEKMMNRSVFISKIREEKNKHRLSNRIKQMRRDRIFPQPIGKSNYKRKFGVLQKNSIKI